MTTEEKPPSAESHAGELAELNVFIEKEGFSGHIKITGVPFPKAVTRLDALIKALVEHEYEAGRRPGNGPPGEAVPQAKGAPAGPPCNDCGEPMELRQGVSKAGKPWKGYFCPADKTHKPVWV